MTSVSLIFPPSMLLIDALISQHYCLSCASCCTSVNCPFCNLHQDQTKTLCPVNTELFIVATKKEHISYAVSRKPHSVYSIPFFPLTFLMHLHDFLCTYKAKNKQHRSALLSHLLLNCQPFQDFLFAKYLSVVYNENIS